MRSILRKISDNIITVVSVMTLFLMASYFLSQSAARIASSIISLFRTEISFVVATDMMEQITDMQISTYFNGVTPSYKLTCVELKGAPSSQVPAIYLSKDESYLNDHLTELSVLPPTIIRMTDAANVLGHNRIIKLHHHDKVYYVGIPSQSTLRAASENLILFLLELSVTVKKDITTAEG